MNDNSKIYLDKLLKIFPDTKSLVEIQCGDSEEIIHCNSLKEHDFLYTGVDVVNEVIKENRLYFRHDNHKVFITLDASSEPLPQADIIVCANMLEYLPISNIWAVLENVRDSGSKYFAVSYYMTSTVNEEINIDPEVAKPTARPINLAKAPFYLPEPICLTPTDDPEKFLAVYDVSEVYFFMDWHNAENAKLRLELVPILQKNLQELEVAFENLENGHDLLKQALCDVEDWSWQKYFFNETYKPISDSELNNSCRNTFMFAMYITHPNYQILKQSADFQSIITEENMQWASVIAQDYYLWYFYGNMDF